MTSSWQQSGIGLAGVGHYYPPDLLALDTVVTPSGRPLRPESLRRLGVKTLRRSAPEETVVDMAVAAGRHALADAGMPAGEVSLLVLSNSTARWFLPDLAPQVADRLGAHQALSFDVGAACAGFVHAVQTAACHLRSGVAENALVVSAEQFSRLTRPGSPDQLVAGDAAGAVLLATGHSAGIGLLDLFLRSDGTQAAVAACTPPEPWIASQPHLFELAVESQLAVVDELLKRSRLTLDDLDWLIPHPGTSQVHTTIRDQLGIGDRLLTNFETVGNTVSAPIPSTLSEHYHAGRIRRGHQILACTVGAGWYAGGMVFTL